MFRNLPALCVYRDVTGDPARIPGYSLPFMTTVRWKEHPVQPVSRVALPLLPFEIVAVVYGIERTARIIIRTPDIYSGNEMPPPLPLSLIGVWQTGEVPISELVQISERSIRRGHGNGVNKTFKSISFSHTCEV